MAVCGLAVSVASTALVIDAGRSFGCYSVGGAALPASRAPIMAAGRSAALSLTNKADTLFRTVFSESPRRAAMTVFE